MAKTAEALYNQFTIEEYFVEEEPFYLPVSDEVASRQCQELRPSRQIGPERAVSRPENVGILYAFLADVYTRTLGY